MIILMGTTISTVTTITIITTIDTVAILINGGAGEVTDVDLDLENRMGSAHISRDCGGKWGSVINTIIIIIPTARVDPLL
jgi:hypothetical protein